jgi:Helix-turn-helix domain
MLQELGVGEQQYRAVCEVLDGASVTEVARRFKVSRQSVHTWLRRYAADGGLGGLGDRSSRPHGCLKRPDFCAALILRAGVVIMPRSDSRCGRLRACCRAGSARW